jgi:glutathione S-transferase
LSLVLHFHPLASYCWKVLIALYENSTPFDRSLVDLSDPEASAAFRTLSPFGKMPALVDPGRGAVVQESSIIIEYLQDHYPGATRFIPAQPDLALRTRLMDRVLDLYVHNSMQKIVGDRLRQHGEKDPKGVGEARETLRTAYAMLEGQLAGSGWAMGDAFTIADCAAAPALFYANKVEPFTDAHARLQAYLDRLLARPSVARTVAEAEPYFKYFPG